MCRIASFFLSQMLKGSMARDARDISTTSERDLSYFFFKQSKAAKEFHAILKEMLTGIHHFIPPSISGWSSLNVLIFRSVLRLVLDDPEQ
jgi:hypothetical protein